MNEIQAANIIQRAWVLKYYDDKNDDLSIDKIICIQSIVRKMYIRRKYIELLNSVIKMQRMRRFMRDSKLDSLLISTVMVQAMFRGKQVRNEVKFVPHIPLKLGEPVASMDLIIPILSI